jgi:type I site-specific restriction endonuclease
MTTEADTCRTYVIPKLYAAGWTDDRIHEQYSFTPGKIVVAGNVVRRGRSKRADYVLYYNRDRPLAVVEAKQEGGADPGTPATVTRPPIVLRPSAAGAPHRGRSQLACQSS